MGEARAGPHDAWPRQLESQSHCPLLDCVESNEGLLELPGTRGPSFLALLRAVFLA